MGQRRSMMFRLGQFVGNVAKGITASVGQRTVVRHDVEERRGERDGQEIVLRRTTIEEVEVRPAHPPRRPDQPREEQA
ncbi:MAG: hypothetical protein H6809_05040 [Phycisphaeraceae bacterium]|nr:hypothetical protein [Phycisphaeraceae bacterium]